MNTNTKPADWDAWTKTFTYSDWKSEWADAPTFMAYVTDKKWYVDFCKKNEAASQEAIEVVCGSYGDEVFTTWQCTHKELTTGCPACGASNE